MGLHAQREVGRKFTDLQRWVNNFIAKEEVVLMVSGIPVKVK
jgi:adenosylcobinamide kinase/adenosylcobinamide-phosphate guanylyltransferase